MEQTEDSIQVFIRLRPGSEQNSIVSYTKNEIMLEKNTFRFTQIFPPSAQQQDVF